MAVSSSRGPDARVMDGCALHAATRPPRRTHRCQPQQAAASPNHPSGAHAPRQPPVPPRARTISPVLRSLSLSNIYNNVIIYQTSGQAASEAPGARLLCVQSGGALSPRPPSSREPFSWRRSALAVGCPPSLENASVGSPQALAEGTAGTGVTPAR